MPHSLTTDDHRLGTMPACSGEDGPKPLPAHDAVHLLELLPNGVVCLDSELRSIYANQAAREFGEWDGARHAGLSVQHIGPQLGEIALHEILQRVLKAGKEERTEVYDSVTGMWSEITISPFGEGLMLHYQDVTAQKQAEASRDAAMEHMKRVEEACCFLTRQFEQVTDATSDGILAVDRHWTMTYLNRQAREALNHYGELVGKNLWDEFSETVGTVAYVNYCRTMAERIPIVFDLFSTRVGGRWLTIESRPSDEGIVIFFRDITERQQAQEALAASERRYRVLADLNPQALWAGDPDGSITYANQFYLDYIGRSSGELLDWISCFDPLDRERVIEVWTRSVQSGVEYDIEARLIRGSDGASRWWHIRAAPVRDESGTITSWLGVSIDIHEAKSAVEALRLKQEETEKQRAELETVYRTTPVGLALFDPVDFRFLRVNERGAEIMGVPESELVGRRLIDLPHVSDVPEIFRQVANGRSFRDLIVEGESPSRPGDCRIWNVNYFPVYGPTGAVEAIATASLDITNQKRSEAALIQSEKLAAVGRLASSISHEINNPLEAVTNLLYLIGTSPEMPPEISEYVHTAQAELSRISQIATQTLRFHRQSVAQTSVTARELVDAVISLYSGRLANSSIQIEARYSTNCHIVCFENDIRQVLNNLIANAIDAMRNGGRLLARAHHGHNREGISGVRITIADTGHGMTGDVQRRIFEPFYTTKGLNGTGLGMWISAGIVDRHLGSLRVRSSTALACHGTVFTLFLPCNPSLEKPRMQVEP